MSYRVIQDADNCGCFQCEGRRVEKEIQEKIAFLCESIGFIPRNYSKEHNYNYLDEQSKTAMSSLFKDMMANVTSIIKENKEIRKEYKKRRGGLAYCFDCGRLHERVKRYKVDSEHYVCSHCFSIRYKICKDCNSVVRKEYMQNHREGVTCRTCFGKFYENCAICGDAYKTSSFKLMILGHGISGVNVCPHCAASMMQCPECGCTYHQSSMKAVIINNNKIIMCKDCAVIETPIHGYGYKPSPTWNTVDTEKHLRPDSLMFGVEWEVENEGVLPSSVIAASIKKIMGKTAVYCKSDSSIYNGFEIVTHPFSWNRFLTERKNWGTVAEYLRGSGCKSKSSQPDAVAQGKCCGIHVHMTKQAFTTFHLYKFMHFIYAKVNKPFMIGISQREENGYAKYSSDKNALQSNVKNKTTMSQDRRMAANLLPNYTLEIRIFASTTNESEFFKNVEFLKSLYEFTKITSIKNVTLSNYLDYVMQNKNQYRNLISFLNSKEVSNLI